jgi:hypothetical protein
MLEGGGATGCSIDTKVELRKISEKIHQINKQTDDSTFLDIQTRLSDKKKREISDCLNDTLTNPCDQKFADNSATQHCIKMFESQPSF